MDKLTYAYYKLKFELELAKSHSANFEGLFQKVLKSIYKEDFVNCIPYGNQGDRKCDGFLIRERKLFQVYAPAVASEANLMKKALEDYEGAINHWEDYFDEWVFVYKHYYDEGITPGLFQTLLDIDDKKISIWGDAEIKLLFDKLSEKDLLSWYGEAPTQETSFGYRELEGLFKHLSKYEADSSFEIKPIIGNKIKANLLSKTIETLIVNGLMHSNTIAGYLKACPDPELGERARVAFNSKYESLKVKEPDTDSIYAGIESWLSQGSYKNPSERQAINAVIAYFFEKCDVFEEPGGSRL